MGINRVSKKEKSMARQTIHKKKKSPLLKEPIIIAPSLLSADFSQLSTELKKIKQAGCRWVHFDIMDGHFVPNLTFGPMVVSALRPLYKRLFFDIHLMIDEPLFFAQEFIKAGAQLITFHQEVDENPDKVIRFLHRNGVQAGISIRPKTSLEAIEPYLNKVELVLIMTVEPGFGGQKMIPSTINKVRQLRLLKEKKRLNFLIEVDGGITDATAPLAVAAGADVLVAGSYIFNDRRISQNVARLRQSALAALTGIENTNLSS